MEQNQDYEESQIVDDKLKSQENECDNIDNREDLIYLVEVNENSQREGFEDAKSNS